MPRYRPDRCECRQEPPVKSGTSHYEDTTRSKRPTLEAMGFDLEDPGLLIDKHDCLYVQAINLLIPEAHRLAMEEVKLERQNGGHPNEARAFHKWMMVLAEKRKLRKPIPSRPVDNGIN